MVDGGLQAEAEARLAGHCSYLAERAMAPHSSTLAWKIPWTEEPGGLQSMGSLRVGHDWAISLSLFTFIIGEGNGNPLHVLAWRIPGTGEPGELPSMGSHRVRHDWSDVAAAVIWTWRLETWASSRRDGDERKNYHKVKPAGLGNLLDVKGKK